MELVTFLKENWAVIAQAPWVFVAIVVLIGGGGLLLGRFWQSGIVTNMESRLALRDDRIAEYERKLDGASPDEAQKKIEALERRLNALEPRSLTEEQAKTLRRLLSARPSAVNIAHDGASSTTKKFHSQLAIAFRESGWRVVTPMVMGLGNPPPSGIAAHGNSDDPAFKVALDALRQAGIAYDLESKKRPAWLEESVVLELTVSTATT